MLMLTVGMHLPLREPRLAASLTSGGLLAAIVCVLAVPAGLLAASIAGTGHAAVYVVAARLGVRRGAAPGPGGDRASPAPR